MKKVVFNNCYGGFGLSQKAYEFLGLEWDGFGYKYDEDKMRTDKKLIECIETLGREADGRNAYLKIEEISDDSDFIIEEYDGWETVVEIYKPHSCFRHNEE